MSETVETLTPSPSNPLARPTRYTVSCLPEDEEEASSWNLTVEYRGRELWAVVRGAYCLAKSGMWAYEIRPSERDDEWYAEHCFDLGTAIELARQYAPTIRVNGLTPAGLLKRRAAEAVAQP